MAKKTRKSEKLSKLIGTNIAEARQHAEVTQEVLAKTIGVTPLYVSAIETGRRLPSLELLMGIADALGSSLDALTAGRT